MSNSQSPEVKLKMLTALAENSGKWIPTTSLATKAGTKSERMQGSLDSFVKRKFVKYIDLESLSKKDREEFIKKQPTEISHSAKMVYQLDVEGWNRLKKSLQDCFQSENVLELLNIPEDVKAKLD